MPFTTVVAGTVITASWGNMVRDQLVTPFADLATCIAQVLVPVEGMLVALATDPYGNTDTLWSYTGAAWVPAAPERVAGTDWTSQTTGTTVETIVTNSSVTFTAIANRRYRVSVSTMVSSNTANDNVTINLRSAAGASVTAAGTLQRSLTAGAAASNATAPATFVDEITGLAAGQTTVGLFGVRYSGTGTWSIGNAVSSNNSLIIDDVGPG